MNDLWIDFLNSDWHDPLGRKSSCDRLEDPGWIRKFIEENDLPRADARSPRTRAVLRELRDLLLRIVRTLVADGSLRPKDVQALNRYLGANPVTSRLEIDGNAVRMDRQPTARGIDAVLFAIAESFATFLVEGDPTRLRTCENPDCRWVFYDTTRSRTRRWCADSCGNLMKVRKHRENKKRRAREKVKKRSSSDDA